MSTSSEYAPSTARWVRTQVETIEASGTTDSVHIQGRPVVMLTMRGARSGAVRKVPLMRVERDGAWAAVASKGSKPEHPQWYFNLKAHPDTRIHPPRERARAVRARMAQGAEREALWTRLLDLYADFAKYATWTDREIPVVILEPR